jgi:hypothetical protein
VTDEPLLGQFGPAAVTSGAIPHWPESVDRLESGWTRIQLFHDASRSSEIVDDHVVGMALVVALIANALVQLVAASLLSVTAPLSVCIVLFLWLRGVTSGLHISAAGVMAVRLPKRVRVAWRDLRVDTVPATRTRRARLVIAGTSSSVELTIDDLASAIVFDQEIEGHTRAVMELANHLERFSEQAR